jgi:hypothetical protein
VERIDHVVEPEPGGLLDELCLGQVAPVVGAAPIKEPALGESAVFIAELQMFT